MVTLPRGDWCPPERRERIVENELFDVLKDRFIKGIRKSFQPCPLIGPKWLQAFPYGRPADFRFFGVRKLSKATGHPINHILRVLTQNVSFEGLEVEVEIRGGMLIDIWREGTRKQPRKHPGSDAKKSKQHSDRPAKKTAGTK
jgi:hypothetical protein